MDSGVAVKTEGYSGGLAKASAMKGLPVPFLVAVAAVAHVQLATVRDARRAVDGGELRERGLVWWMGDMGSLRPATARK